MNIFDLTFNNQVLKIEREHLFNEGKDLADAVEDDFRALLGMNLLEDPSAEVRVQVLQGVLAGLQICTNNPYVEPYDLEYIRAARPEGPRRFSDNLDPPTLYDRIQANLHRQLREHDSR